MSASGTTPKPGSMAFIRAWYGIPAKRGAPVTINGQRGWITSASSGYLNVRLWNNGQRIRTRPGELNFN